MYMFMFIRLPAQLGTRCTANGIDGCVRVSGGGEMVGGGGGWLGGGGAGEMVGGGGGG